MRLFITCVLTALALLTQAQPLTACTVFVVVRDGQVYFCNNEDMNKPGYIWYQTPQNGKLGRVNLGFSDGFAQGSMNEAGLAFDGMALGPTGWQADPDKQSIKRFIDKIMDECQTVAAALDYFKRYNATFLADSQVMFADATGDVALVCWLPETGLHITRAQNGVLLGTNTRLPVSGYRCARFTKAESLLARLSDTNPAQLATVLQAVHQHGAGAFTTYSHIFDLKTRQIHLYQTANFTDPVVIDLAEQLKRVGDNQRISQRFIRLVKLDTAGAGDRPRPIAGLFEQASQIDQLRALPQRSDFDTQIRLPPNQLARFAGTYAPRDDRSMQFRIRVDQDQLTVSNPGQPDRQLFAESATTFRIAPDRGQVTFITTADGKVTGLILHKQIDLHAVRIGD